MIIERMASYFSTSPTFILKLAKSASHRYKEYQIPKRNGGLRTIHHPARELKLLQYWLIKNVLRSLPVHPAATAYQAKTNIRLNALKHVNNNYLLRVDFQDFFPSLKGADVIALLVTNRNRLTDAELSDMDIEFAKQIVCRFDSLTIGAPTSPLLSNAIMFDFDLAWSEIATKQGIAYTRYADDLYFSTNQPNVLSGTLEYLRSYLHAMETPTLTINERKTAFSSRKRRRLVAGLVLTSDRSISIGRRKKRMLKGLVNRLKNKQLDQQQVAQLRGWIAYLRSVEPRFVVALQKKYSLDFEADVTWKA